MMNSSGVSRSPISAFVICMNEEDQIGACLDSLDFCDEILVIDSYSTDRTVEIATSRGARVIQRSWPGYRDQKAFGLTAVTHEWVVNVDADERITPELRASILRVLAEDYERTQRGEKSTVNGYYVNRVVFFLNRWWRLGGWYPEYRLRVFRRQKVVWGGLEPHEKPIVDGDTAILPGELQHFTYKSVDDQLSRLHALSTIAARAEFGEGRRANIRGIILNPLLRFIKFFVLKRGYREGAAGLVVAMAEGYYTFMKYAKLWELEFLTTLESRRRPGKNTETSPSTSNGKIESEA